MIREFTLSLFFYAVAAAAYEDIPQIHITEVIPPDITQSVSHRVEDATLVGNYIQFRVESELGILNVKSLPLLITRVREISILNQAVNQLERQDGGFSEYSRGKYQVSANSAIDILTSPVSTASNVAGQVRRNLENTESGNITNEYSGTGSRNNVPEDPVIVMHMRNIASQWGLDIYSSNPEVQSFLKDAATARAAGKISTGAPVILNRDAMRLKILNENLEYEIRILMKNKSISELNDINGLLLSGMHINGRLIRKFLYHVTYTPRHKSAISHYLELLNGVANRSALLELAVTADTERAALGYQIMSMMLAYYHENINRLSKLYSGNEILQAITMNNRMLFFSTADIIYWSEETEKVFDTLSKQAETAGFSERELITIGVITDQASEMLKDRKFVLRERFIF